jgi:hypothetical protein
VNFRDFAEDCLAGFLDRVMKDGSNPIHIKTICNLERKPGTIPKEARTSAEP